MFICNHCPYVRHVREHLAQLVREYQARGLAVVGISSNDVAQFPEDGPEGMKEEARTVGYTFPYLFDRDAGGGQGIPRGLYAGFLCVR